MFKIYISIINSLKNEFHDIYLYIYYNRIRINTLSDGTYVIKELFYWSICQLILPFLVAFFIITISLAIMHVKDDYVFSAEHFLFGYSILFAVFSWEGYSHKSLPFKYIAASTIFSILFICLTLFFSFYSLRSQPQCPSQFYMICSYFTRNLCPSQVRSDYEMFISVLNIVAILTPIPTAALFQSKIILGEMEFLN